MILSTMFSKVYFKAISLILVFGLLCPQAVWADVIADEIREEGAGAPLVSFEDNDNANQIVNEAIEEVEPIAEQPPQPETKPLTKKEEILAKILGKLQERWARRIEKAENREVKEAQEIPGQNVSNQEVFYNIGRRVERIMDKVMEGPVGKIIKEIQAKRQEIGSLAHKVKVLVAHLKELALRSEVIYNRVRHLERLTTGYGEVHTIDETDDVTSIDEIEEVNIPTPEQIKQAIEELEDIQAEVASIKDELANLIVLDDDGNPVEIPTTVVTEIKEALVIADELQLKIDGYIQELTRLLELADVPVIGKLKELVGRLKELALKSEEIYTGIVGVLVVVHENRPDGHTELGPVPYIPTPEEIKQAIEELKDIKDEVAAIQEELKKLVEVEVDRELRPQAEVLLNGIVEAVEMAEKLKVQIDDYIAELEKMLEADPILGEDNDVDDEAEEEEESTTVEDELNLLLALMEPLNEIRTFIVENSKEEPLPENDDLRAEKSQEDLAAVFLGMLITLVGGFIDMARHEAVNPWVGVGVGGGLIAWNHRDEILGAVQGAIGVIGNVISDITKTGVKAGEAAIQTSLRAVGGVLGLIGALLGQKREDPKPNPSPSPAPSPAPSPSPEDGEDNDVDDEAEEELPQPAPSPETSPTPEPEDKDGEDSDVDYEEEEELSQPTPSPSPSPSPSDEDEDEDEEEDEEEEEEELSQPTPSPSPSPSPSASPEA